MNKTSNASLKAALAIAAIASFVASPACDCGAPAIDPALVAGDGFDNVVAVDDRTVLLRFSVDLKDASGAFGVVNYTVVPPVDVGVDVEKTGARELTLRTDAALVPGAVYTVEVDGAVAADGRKLSGTINFTAAVDVDVRRVRIVVNDVETARLHDELVVLATVGEAGAFSEALVERPLVDVGGAFVAEFDVVADPARTVDAADDADPVADRRAYGVILNDGTGGLASALVQFVVPAGDGPFDVELDVLSPLQIVDPPVLDTLPDPPVDDAPGDGRRVVRIVVDDRASRELTAPALKVSFGADGQFDASFPQTLTLTPMSGDNVGYWEAVVAVAVDPARVVDGTSADTFPYFAFLVEAGVAYEALSVSVVAPDENAQTVRLALGNPEWTPVTFRVDASRAYLNVSGSERGVRSGEAVFLTGEWSQAVDALGSNCGDAFSGGEQLCLKMRELDDKPGVWTRTLWLPPGRPYGWKVVRCDAAAGCAPLNRLVSSSGRAFATVMKNLVTDNVDAFADPSCGLVDPLNPQATAAAGSVFDYRQATVFQGSGVGGEEDPSGTPDGLRMFKQEVPDLVVVVADVPQKTRVIHVATWRDVNLGSTPQQIISGNLAVDLGPADYDDGFIGRFPASREEP
jgi:hypothetical protein